MTDSTTETEASAAAGSAPSRAGLVLISLILVAAVANLNLAVANVALPDIGKAFDSSQTTLNLIAVGYSLGLAASVLYLGALGDRYGRKLMLILGTALSIPACLLAACAPTDDVLFVARVLGGLSRRHGLPDDARADHRAVVRAGAHEVDRALVGARRRDLRARPAARRLAARALLVGLGLPDHAAARRRGARAWRSCFVPAHVNETTEPVDNLGGILSVVLVGALILAINFAPVPNKGTLVLGLAAIARRRADRVLPPPAPGEEPALRPRTSPAARSSGSRPAPGSSCSAR